MYILRSCLYKALLKCSWYTPCPDLAVIPSITQPAAGHADTATQNNKPLLDEVFVICGIIKVEVSVISRDEGEADNTYQDLDNSAYHKNRIQ